MMFEGGLAPRTLGEEDYFELLELMKAKSREDRPLDPSIAFAKMRGGQ